MKVLQFPLAKITLWFIAGILFAFYANPDAFIIFSALTIAGIGFGIAYYFSNKSFLQNSYFGLVAYVFAFFFGSATLVSHSGYFDRSNYIHQIDDSQKSHSVEVVLRERLKSSIYNNRYVAHVKTIDGKLCSGKLLVNLNRSYKENFPIGTNLQINEKIFRHKKPRNPDQFDYGNYLSTKSIMAQVYVGSGHLKIGNQIQKDAFYYSDQLRTRILNNLERNHFNPTELAVVAALILGQQQDINSDIMQDYQFAGAVHILSVSGLHVGFILMFLTFLLRLLPNTKWNRRIRLSIIIISLWGFAILAGLSPSVVRSVTMFSFVAVGMHLKRNTDIFHTLLVSMLLILAFKPSFLFDVGFQLSYVALFFILWLQPVLAAIWNPKNKIVLYFWQLLTVSFAAQIGTLPLSLYYFHQFPGLFFVTNLLVIPLLSVVMGLGILVMIPAAFNYVPQMLVALLEWSIAMLNKIIHWVASFEQFIISDISLNRYLMMSAYILIIAIIIWLKKPNFGKAIFAVCALIIFQGCYFGTQWSHETQNEWIVFDVKKSTMITERNGKQITVYSNDKIDKNRLLTSYAVANFSEIMTQKPLRNTAFFNNKKILILDSLSVYPNHCNPDVLLLTKSPKINLDRLLQNCNPKIIVADASNYKSYIQLWKATCKAQKIPFHATAETGYYKL